MEISFDGFALTGKQIHDAFVGSGRGRNSYSRWRFDPSSHYSLLVFSKDKPLAHDLIKGTRALPLVTKNGNDWEPSDISEACSVTLPALLPETRYSEIDVRVGDGVIIHEYVAFTVGHGGEELYYFMDSFRRNLLKCIEEKAGDEK